MTPRVSAIVPARSLTEHGRRCLERLLALGEDVEVVFVPDERPGAVDPRVRIVASGAAPAGAKRQLGLEASTGEFVALIDDDAYPAGDWLAHALAAFGDAGVGAVCGPTLTPPDDGELERLGGRVYASPLVGGPHRWRYEPRAPRDVDDAPSVNLVLRRDDALAVRLDSPYYPGDDTIVCDRLVRRGRRIRYVPGAVVFHSRRPLWVPHLRQVWRFGRRRGTFVRRVGGNSVRPSYFAPSALLVWTTIGARVAPRLWRASLAAYAAACVVEGANARSARVAAAIPATHAAYGAAFLLGLAGVPLPEDVR